MSSRKKRSPSGGGEESGGGGGWEIVYSGFAMILLCFFIMLSSFSTMQEARVMSFVRSFVDAVSIMSGGVKPGDGEVILNPAAPMVEAKHELATLMNDLKKLAQEENLKSEVLFQSIPKGLAMRLNDSALFDLGAAEINSGALRLLKSIGDIIARSDYHVRIEGHTDDLPIRTDRFPSNWELSTARAVNVLRQLQTQSRVAPQRLSAVGFGQHRPIYPNDSPSHRARNRRVEIIFLRQDPPTGEGR